MAKLHFEPSGLTLELSVDPAEGLRVLDVLDDCSDCGVPYSCRSANCGTCRVQIVRGGELFAPPREDELAVLDLFGTLPNERLACQLLMVREGEATLKACET